MSSDCCKTAVRLCYAFASIRASTPRQAAFSLENNLRALPNVLPSNSVGASSSFKEQQACSASARQNGARKLALFAVAMRVAESHFDMVFVAETRRLKMLHFYFHGLA